MGTVIDFHSHVLPGIDDGSASVAESITMLQWEAAQGIRRVVATPHFYARYDTPDLFLEKRDRAEALLQAEMEKYDSLPELIMGAEVYYFRGISDSDLLPRLTIQGTDSILIEMPNPPWPDTVYRELEAIWRQQGLRPIIAHIDRYIGPFRTYGIPKRLAQLPVMVQANSDFFLERTTAGMALRMLREGQIHLLGSDCHNLTSRKPNLSLALAAISRRLGPEAIEHINACEQEILY